MPFHGRAEVPEPHQNFDLMLSFIRETKAELREEFGGKVKAVEDDIHEVRESIKEIKADQKEIRTEIQTTRETITIQQRDNMKSIIRWQAGILLAIITSVVGLILQFGFHLFFH